MSLGILHKDTCNPHHPLLRSQHVTTNISPIWSTGGEKEKGSHFSPASLIGTVSPFFAMWKTGRSFESPRFLSTAFLSQFLASPQTPSPFWHPYSIKEQDPCPIRGMTDCSKVKSLKNRTCKSLEGQGWPWKLSFPPYHSSTLLSNVRKNMRSHSSNGSHLPGLFSSLTKECLVRKLNIQVLVILLL